MGHALRGAPLGARAVSFGVVEAGPGGTPLALPRRRAGRRLRFSPRSARSQPRHVTNSS